MLELAAVFIVALLAGGIASVSGFGIGSLLTPLLALRLDLQLAVAAVSIPHVVGTALRFIFLRPHLRKDVFVSFGIWSAIGGLAGALLHNVATNPSLTIIFACLLLFAGGTGLFGQSKLCIPPAFGCLAGLGSGAFGGLVGNQGGIRSAALLSYDLTKEEFVATATGIGLIVDAARMPVYFINRLSDLMSIWQVVFIASAGVVLGTWLGKLTLAKIPEHLFKKSVAILLVLLGLFMLFRAHVPPT